MEPACAARPWRAVPWLLAALAATAHAGEPSSPAAMASSVAPARSVAGPAVTASSALPVAAASASPAAAIPLTAGPDDVDVGNINGIKVAIPRFLLESGVYYQGRVSPTARKKKDRPTYQSSIESFDIALRLATLRPIRTRDDLREHTQSRQLPPTTYSTLWATIDLSPSIYPIEGSLRASFANWQQDLPHGGPVARQSDTLSGLVHATSTEAVDDRGQRINRQYDYYFDESRWQTFGYCQTDRGRSGNEMLSDCKLDFLIADFRVFAEAELTQRDVARWKEIEAATRDLLRTLVVNP